MNCLVVKSTSQKEIQYNIIMINELELKLNEINTEIENLKGGGGVGVAELIWTLEGMKEWLEGMITNYCD